MIIAGIDEINVHLVVSATELQIMYALINAAAKEPGSALDEIKKSGVMVESATVKSLVNGWNLSLQDALQTALTAHTSKSPVHVVRGDGKSN